MSSHEFFILMDDNLVYFLFVFLLYIILLEYTLHYLRLPYLILSWLILFFSFNFLCNLFFVYFINWFVPSDSLFSHQWIIWFWLIWWQHRSQNKFTLPFDFSYSPSFPPFLQSYCSSPPFYYIMPLFWLFLLYVLFFSFFIVIFLHYSWPLVE